MSSASIYGDFTSEPFFDEKNPDTGSSGNNWGSTGGGGGGGYGWGGGGGGGGGGPAWPNIDPPLLRTGAGGYLFSCGNYLLRGDSSCPVIPILGTIDGEKGQNHLRCLLFRSSVPIRWRSVYDAGDWQFGGYFDWTVPQKFTFGIKWQTGHHDIAEVNGIRLSVFGIDLGRVTLALGADYKEIATIRIDGGNVFVNSLKADFSGNMKYVE